MAWSMFDICCDCGAETCVACSDAFTRADSSNIATGAPSGCGYAQYGEAAWEIVSNKLAHTSASGDSLAIVTPSSGDSANMGIAAVFSITTLGTGRRAGIVFDFVDDENYRFADFYVTAATAGKWNITIRYGTVVATVETIVYEQLYVTDTTLASGIIDAEMCVHKTSGEIVVYYLFGTPSGEYSITVAHPGSPTLASGVIANSQYATVDDFVLYRELTAECPECDTFACESTPGVHYFTEPLDDDFSSDTLANYDVVWAVDHPDGTEVVSGGLLTLEHPDGSLDAEVRGVFNLPIFADTIELDIEVTSTLATTAFSIFSVAIQMGDASVAKLQYDFPGSSADVTLTGGTAPGSDNIASRATTLRLVLTAQHVGSGYYDLTGKIYYGATLMSTVTSDDFFNLNVAGVGNGKEITGCGVVALVSFDLTATSVIDVDVSIDRFKMSWS